MQIDLKKFKQDILVIVGFALLALLYCYPQLQGKKLNQHDNISWQGMAQEAKNYHETTGKDALWSNSMFGGMPTYTTYVGAANTNYTGYVQTVLQSVGKPAYFFFIAMLCFYLLMRVLNINKWLSMVGAIAYAFSTYNAIIISVGHETKMLTMGYLPAAMAGLYLVYREKWLTGAAVLGLSFALIFSNNHFQVIYYSFIMFGFFGLVMLYVAIKEGRLKQFFISSGIAAVTMAAGIGPSMPSLLTTAEYAKETMRGGASELSGHDKKENGGLDKEYAFRWSNGIGETFCLMIPYLYGGSSGEAAEKAPKTLEAIGGGADQLPLYWGPQPFLSGPVYFGAIVCFLFVLGIFAVRSPHKWWIIAASAACVVLSWGKNMESINFFLFDHLPYLNKFRTPSMALVIPQFLFPLLGIWGVQEILDRRDDPQTWKNIKLAAGITAGICILIGVGGSMFFDFTGGSDDRLQPEMVKLLKEDRVALAMRSGLTSAVFILLAAGMLWAYLKDRIKSSALFVGLGVLVVIDLLPMSNNYLNESNYVDASEYETIFQPRDVDMAIMKDPDPYYRVLDLTRDPYNDAVQAYFHKCVGGYHPAKMEIYQDLIDRQMSRGFNGQVLNMLNTKYIIAGQKGGAPQVIPNPTACGNAWFVNEIKWVNTADDEMNALNAPQIGDTALPAGAFSPMNTVVLRTRFKEMVGNASIGKDSSASIKLNKYGLDELSFTSTNSKEGIAVFSDIYYPKGWKAYVDDKETPIMRANYVLRAVKVPAGNHKIEFRFKPDSFYTGQKVAFVSSIVLVLLCLGALYKGFMKPAEG
ncbi:MAG: YfhO family protein [Chitinophagaceae bacterium]|nr:YfhO family protein [Chitinophagaceae bacterium]